MSAPPSGLPNGQNQPANSNTAADPSGRPRPPHPRRRPRHTADPLVARRRPQPKKDAATRPGASRPSGAARNNATPAMAHMSNEAKRMALLSRIAECRSKKNGKEPGWSEPLPEGGHEYKIELAPRGENTRFHAMKFHSSNIDKGKGPVDPTNQEEFTRPVTLQRRDPRQPAAGREVKVPEPPPPEPKPEDEKEAERVAKLKADKEAWKAMEAAKSAPSLKDPNANKVKAKKEEEERVQFQRTARTEQEKKQQALRYEEALPWHIEDHDGKNVWVGSYVAPMSETHAVLVATTDGKFRVIPLEKWYKFVAKPNFEAMRLEEAEALHQKQGGVSRWVMQEREKEAKEKEMKDTRSYFHGPSRVKLENQRGGASREDMFDLDQIDFDDGQEFQDDDEAPNFEPDNDEDQRHATDRIRRDQLGANLFGAADEAQVEKEEEAERKREEARRIEGKKMTKALIKREKETIYQSDDDSGYDPFESSSSSSDSEDEENKDKENEENKEDKDDDKASSQDPSSQKTEGKGKEKGTLTPSGKQKQADAAKKGKNLKRPGSPNLSESSGTESTRKKKQKKNSSGSVQPSRSGTPLPGGQKSKLGAGATSDGEATGGEMSDGARQKKKLKLLGKGAKATPTGSRAGSPAPAGAASPTSPNARAGSPAQVKPIEVSEIIAVLPPLPDGLPIGALISRFPGRIGEKPGQTPRQQWIAMVKNNCSWGADKLIRRRE